MRLIKPGTLSLQTLNSPLSVRWDLPEEPADGRCQKTVVWVTRGDGEEAEEGGSHAEGDQTQHQPCWSYGKSEGHKGHDDQSDQGARWDAPFVEASLVLAEVNGRKTRV